MTRMKLNIKDGGEFFCVCNHIHSVQSPKIQGEIKKLLTEGEDMQNIFQGGCSYFKIFFKELDFLN